MRIRKSIEWAYPTSPNAKELGKGSTGCWHVSQYIRNEAGEWSAPFIPVGTEGDTFDTPDNPELIALYNELEGDICPFFKNYGNTKALAAIGLKGFAWGHKDEPETLGTFKHENGKDVQVKVNSGGLLTM